MGDAHSVEALLGGSEQLGIAVLPEVIRKDAVGFIFQPGTKRASPLPAEATRTEVSSPLEHRLRRCHAALEALTVGEFGRLDELFTHDVRYRSPHVSVRSRVDLLQVVGQPESSLGDIDITVWPFWVDSSAVVAEWRIEASLVAPVLFGDNVLIEPSGDRLQLLGALFAEFSGDLISAFRCYFDDSEMLDGVSAMTHPLRLVARWNGAPESRDAR